MTNFFILFGVRENIGLFWTMSFFCTKAKIGHLEF